MRAAMFRRLFGFVLVAAAAVARADDDRLTQAYAAILRGDYDRGLAALRQIRDSGDQRQDVDRVSTWLSSYQDFAQTRSEINQKTYDWHVERAQAALGEGKTYLALAFTAQAHYYAADEGAFLSEPWVAEVTQKAVAEARRHADENRWSKALSYYANLERVFGENSPYKKLREEAGRHVRFDLLYPDRAALDRRVKDVDYDLLRSSLRQIDKSYYQKPDFRAMTEGALDNIETLCQSEKLAKYLDGLANPDSRKLFLDRLRALRESVRKQEHFFQRDVLDIYNQLRDVNRKSIELPESLVIVEFLEGAVGKLDEFTSIVWPSDSSEFDKLMMGGFEGVGIQLGIDEVSGRLKVATPLEDSPALEAGIQPDDLIVKVDGVETKGWSTDDAVRNIMGPANSKVTLTMFRPAEGREINFTLTRRKIVLRTVRGVERIQGARGDAWNYMLDRAQGIAYIRLTAFQPQSEEELKRALNDARSQGMRALVLDLRYNPGGLLDVAIEIVSTFLERGEVVSTRGRQADERQHVDVTGDAEFGDLPLVMLVNESSASASEILAGALQDHDRALVLGERSYGKGSVQRVLPLGPRARLKLTTALYYLPDGRSPHREPGQEEWGVEPDLLVKLTPKEARTVIRRQNRSLIIHNGQNDNGAKLKVSDEDLAILKDSSEDDEDDNDVTPLLTEADLKLLDSDPHEAPSADPQLEMALLQLRVKLAGNLPWPTKMAAASTSEASANR